MFRNQRFGPTVLRTGLDVRGSSVIDDADEVVIITGVGQGLGEGWLAEPGSDSTFDDVAWHLTEVLATQPSSIPASIFDDIGELRQQPGVAR